MSTTSALRVTRSLLRILVLLNYLSLSIGLVMLIASLLAPQGGLMGILNTNPADATGAVLLDIRLVLVMALAANSIMVVVLQRLLEIVDTVGAGHPFVSRNAQRLMTIGWMLLALNVLEIAGGYVSRGLPATSMLKMNWEFSFPPWLALLLTFVLARVFEHGARMREELDGTV